MFINSASSRVSGCRRRFTGAHEFGHYSIPTHREGIRSGRLVHRSETGFRSIERIEREADIFAAHFLIPTAELKFRYAACVSGALQIIVEVHRNFHTLVECAALRCQVALPKVTSTLIRWEGDRVSWQRMNNWDWRFTNHACEEGIRTSNRLALMARRTDRLFSRRKGAREWISCRMVRRDLSGFRESPSGRTTTICSLRKRSPLGSFGVLTLLRPDTR